MKSPHQNRCAAACIALLLLGFPDAALRADAQSERKPIVETFDLSPGADVYGPSLLALNRATHKLFVAKTGAVKIVDTGSGDAIAGIELTPHADGLFSPEVIAMDETRSPVGGRAYIVGSITEEKYVLRVVESGSGAALTSEGTDLVLPAGAQLRDHYQAGLVDPTTNKVYLSTSSGRVLVVDGPNLRVVKTLTPQAGFVLALNANAKKLFVFGRNGGAIISTSDDTITPLSLGFVEAYAAVFNEADGRIYLAAQLQDRAGIFVLDGTTGAVIAEKKLPYPPADLAVAPDANVIYASLAPQPLVTAYDTTTLEARKTFSVPPAAIVYDSTSRQLFLRENSGTAVSLKNSLGILDPESGVLRKLTVGYTPVALATNAATKRTYVMDAWAPEVTVLNSETHQVVARITTSPKSVDPLTSSIRADVASSAALNRFYVPRRTPTSTPSSVIEVYDGATNQFRNAIAVNTDSKAEIADIEVDDKRGVIYVSATRDAGAPNQLRNLIYVFDSRTEALKTVVTLSLAYRNQWRQLCLNEETGFVYFTTADGKVEVIRGDTYTPAATVSIGGVATAAAVDTQRNKIFIAGLHDAPNDPAARKISVMDGATNLIERTITFPIGTAAIHALGVDHARGLLFASFGEKSGGKVEVFDIEHGYASLGTLNTPGAADLRLSPDGTELLSANLYDGSVGVLRMNEWKLFGNIATRGRVGSSDAETLIGGFIVDGPPGSTKRVIVRAIGASLATSGVEGALADAVLELHDSAGNVITNDDWKIDAATNTSQEAVIRATGIAPTEDTESAIVATLPPGPCTAIIRGKDGASGVALVEIYDGEQTSRARIANISTRAMVQAGDGAMIGGLIVQGLQPSRVLLRALGPALTDAGVADALQDTTIELRDDNGSLVDFNDDWKIDETTGLSQEAEIAASTIAPTHDAESAISATLAPGNYTAIVRGKADTVGVGLVEAYQLN